MRQRQAVARDRGRDVPGGWAGVVAAMALGACSHDPAAARSTVAAADAPAARRTADAALPAAAPAPEAAPSPAAPAAAVQRGTAPTAGGAPRPRFVPPAGSVARQGEPCDGRGCEEGTACLTYYGLSGRQKLTSCEIPCGTGQKKCPQGQTCTTISDGPGRVCQRL